MGQFYIVRNLELDEKRNTGIQRSEIAYLVYIAEIIKNIFLSQLNVTTQQVITFRIINF